jgi:hypothetical protein
MRGLLSIIVVALAVWVIVLRGRLRAAERRGDMYREAAARLDRTVVELGHRP